MFQHLIFIFYFVQPPPLSLGAASEALRNKKYVPYVAPENRVNEQADDVEIVLDEPTGADDPTDYIPTARPASTTPRRAASRPATPGTSRSLSPDHPRPRWKPCTGTPALPTAPDGKYYSRSFLVQKMFISVVTRNGTLSNMYQKLGMYQDFSFFEM